MPAPLFSRPWAEDSDMATEAQMGQWRSGVEDALNASDGAELYELRQRQMRRGRGAAENRARPLEFDDLGFPIPQPIPRFVRRVGRVISGG